MPNVNDQFFDGSYKDIWRAWVPEKLTEKEIEFMVPYFGLKPGMRVLDLMCGYGRHAIALGRIGIEVAAIDNLADYTDEIKTIAEKEALPVNVYTSDIVDFQAKGLFDLAICMGNSLNFFDEADLIKIFRKVSDSLNIGGAFLINTWSLTEIAIERFNANNASEIAGYTFENNNKLLYQPTRIESENIITGKDGKPEYKRAIDYLFSTEEMEKMLKKAGLDLDIIFSIPGKKKFEIGDPRAYIIADKKS